MDIKVLGIGNTLMGDDGIGVIVTDTLYDKLQLLNIKTIISETDADFCIENITSEDYLIIIDAVKLGHTPGTVCIKTINEILKNRNLLITSHSLCIIDLIKLYFHSINGIVIGIEVNDISYSNMLSLPLQKNLPVICNKVLKIIYIEASRKHS